MLCTSSRKHRILAAVLIAAVLAPAACSPKAPASAPVQDAVRSYNVQLVRAFRAHDMNLLNSVATRDQAYTEFFQMAALGESGVTLESTLTAIAFRSVSFSGDASATAETDETWDYRHVSNETSKTVRSESGIVYHLRYDLVLVDGRWLVDRVTSLDSTGSAAPGGE